MWSWNALSYRDIFTKRFTFGFSRKQWGAVGPGVGINSFLLTVIVVFSIFTVTNYAPAALGGR